MLLPRSEKTVVHVDMNSYFASVEQQANPFLRGRPVGVCSYLHEKGCVIAASVEAKRFGIRVGMTVFEARRMCPHAVFVQNDPAKYRTVTSRIFSILGELTDRLEPYSIDEAFLDLTGWCRDSAEAAWMLTRARQRIQREVGEWLRCSIGIAPTRFLAKTASKLKKPNGLTIIDHQNLDAVLGTLSLRDLHGVGPRMEKRLKKIGIFSPLALKQYPVANLIRLFGKYGFMMWVKLHAAEPERILRADEDNRKSIGHSYCIPDVVNREGRVVSVLIKLTERAARRMRSYGYSASVVNVSIGFRDESAQHPISFRAGDTSRWCRLDEPANDSFTLTDTATRLLYELWSGERLGFLAVTLSEFSTPNGQSILFAPVRSEKQKRISTALDAIRDRYGTDAVMLGSMFGAEDHAHDRIGFRKLDGVRVES